MSLKNGLRAQAAVEYLLLACIAILALVSSTNLVFKLKGDQQTGFGKHFNQMQSVISTGWN